MEPPVTHRTRATLETLHTLLGHAADRAFLAGSDAEIWEDIQAIPATVSFCLPCKMACISCHQARYDLLCGYWLELKTQWSYNVYLLPILFDCCLQLLQLQCFHGSARPLV